MSKEYIEQKVVDTFSESLRKILSEHNVMLCGGALTSAFSNKEVNDLDLYFRSKEDLLGFLDAISHYRGNAFINSITDKSMTLVRVDDLPLQLIYFEYFEDIHDVFKKFDWTINMCGYDFKDKKLSYHKDFFSDLAQRRLSFNKTTAFPLISALRVSKYKEKGFSISKSEMLKVLLEVSKLNIKTKDDFVKHVGGMYGATVLSAVSSMKEFSIDKALELISEEHIETRGLFGISKPIDNLSESVPNVAELMGMEDVKYVVVGDEGYLYCSDGDMGKWSLGVLKAFFPDGAVDCQLIEDGIYYKWVYEGEESGEYTSIHDSTFKYRLGVQATDKKDGLYLLTKDSIGDHYFRQKSGSVVIACYAEAEDFLKFDSNSRSSGKFAVRSLRPLYEIKEGNINGLGGDILFNPDKGSKGSTSFPPPQPVLSI